MPIADHHPAPTRKITEKAISTATMPAWVIWITQRCGSRAIKAVYACMITPITGPAARIMIGRFSAVCTSMNVAVASGLRMLYAVIARNE